MESDYSRLVADENGGTFKTVQELSAFYAKVIDRVEHSTSAPIPGLVQLVIGKARTDISIARALVNSRLPQNLLGPGGYVPETECFNAPTPEGTANRRCQTMSLAVRNFDNDPAGFIPFALGRSLKQIDGSIDRLERICELRAAELSLEEEQWMESLTLTLQDEYQSLVKTARRF